MTEPISPERLNEEMHALYTQVTAALAAFSESLKKPLASVVSAEPKELQAVSDHIGALIALLTAVPPPPVSVPALAAPLSAPDVDRFTKDCLDQLILMRVINQNIQDAYRSMNAITAKREKCNEFLLSYVRYTKAIQTWITQDAV